MRIAIASFQHETNTFSPHLTHYQDFIVADGWPAMLRGSQVIEQLAGLNIACQGFIAAAQRSGHQLYPINWCSAEPAGKVTSEAFERICDEIVNGLSQIGEVDALYLDLHGAMVTQDYFDGEAQTLKRVRAQLGQHLPIVASLDFHANLSREFVDDISQMALYRTYPHVDMADTGSKCLKLLEQLVSSTAQQEPVVCKAFKQIPYLIPLSSQHTGSQPMIELYDVLQLLEKDRQILNIEFALGFPPADIPDSGASICVFAKDQISADRVCQQFYQKVLSVESKFKDNLLTTEQALIKGNQNTTDQPLVIADVQDNPGAGGSADSTGILQDLVMLSDNKLSAKKVIIAALCDAQVVELAHRAGKGALIHASLGAKGTDQCLPYDGPLEVLAVTDGRFICTGEMYAGCQVELGASALLKVVCDGCDIHVVVTSVRYACTDLALYAHFGLNPLDYEVLVVKSTVHFRAAFETISNNILLVKSPGLHPCQLDELKYQFLREGVRLGPLGTIYQG